MPSTFRHIPLEEYLHLDQYIPRALDEARLAELKALCYEDDLQQAYIVLHQQHVYMYFSKHQSDLDMSDAIKRVLTSLDEKALEAQNLRAKLERIEKRLEEKNGQWSDEKCDRKVAGDHVPAAGELVFGHGVNEGDAPGAKVDMME